MGGATAKGLLLADHEPSGSTSASRETLARPLFPVANKPLLLHALEGMRAAGVREVSIVVSAAGCNAIQEVIGDRIGRKLRIEYLCRETVTGVVGALLAADRFLDGSPCLVQWGDGLLQDDVSPFLEMLDGDRLDALMLVDGTGRSDLPGVGDQRILRLLGFGPGSASAQLAGLYIFGPRFLLEAQSSGAGGTPPSLAQALEHLVAAGGRAQAHPLRGWWRWVPDADALLEANRLLLEGVDQDHSGAVLTDSVVQGRVSIEPSATLESTLVRGPAIIGANVHLRHAYIGPYTSVGDDVVVEGAEIEHSVIFPEARIKHVGSRLEGSVVGRGARVMRSFGLPRAMRLRVADGNEVLLG